MASCRLWQVVAYGKLSLMASCCLWQVVVVPDKTADVKVGQNRRFCKRGQTSIKIVSLIFYKYLVFCSSFSVSLAFH